MSVIFFNTIIHTLFRKPKTVKSGKLTIGPQKHWASRSASLDMAGITKASVARTTQTDGSSHFVDHSGLIRLRPVQTHNALRNAYREDATRYWGSAGISWRKVWHLHLHHRLLESSLKKGAHTSLRLMSGLNDSNQVWLVWCLSVLVRWLVTNRHQPSFWNDDVTLT